MLNLAQLLRVPHVDSGLKFDISPDGQRLIFSWNKTGRCELYEIRLGEVASASPLPISQKQGSKFSPFYFSDGTMLAFAIDLDGNESYQIIVHDLNTNISKNLMPNCLRASAKFLVVT